MDTRDLRGSTRLDRLDSLDSIDSIARLDGMETRAMVEVCREMGDRGCRTQDVPPFHGAWNPRPRSIDRSPTSRVAWRHSRARTTMASITQSAVLGNVRAFKAAKATKRCVCVSRAPRVRARWEDGAEDARSTTTRTIARGSRDRSVAISTMRDARAGRVRGRRRGGLR